MLPSCSCERTGSDEIITLLEDVGLNLQSMLSSRYVQPFVEEVRPRGQEQLCTLEPFASVIMYEHVHLLPTLTLLPLTWLSWAAGARLGAAAGQGRRDPGHLAGGAAPLDVPGGHLLVQRRPASAAGSGTALACVGQVEGTS